MAALVSPGVSHFAVGPLETMACMRRGVLGLGVRTTAVGYDRLAVADALVRISRAWSLDQPERG